MSVGGRSLHATDQALEILVLAAVSPHRVVGSRAAYLENLDGTPSSYGDSVKHFDELIAHQASRAAAGDENPAGFQQADGL